MDAISHWCACRRPVGLSAPCRLQQLDVMHSEGGNPKAFFHEPMDDVWLVWEEEMAVAAIDLREERGIVEGGHIFEGDEFHGLAVLRMSRFLCDQYTDHGDALADELLYVRSGDRSQAVDLCVIER